MIFGSIAGLQRIPGFPFIFDQSFGVCVGVLGMVLWSARDHLRDVFKQAWHGGRRTDANEPMSYRVAVLGLIFGFLLLAGFWWVAGMSFWVAVLVFAIHLTTVTVITRIRAELGPPIHDLRSMGPDVLLPKMFGMRRLGGQNLALFSLNILLQSCLPRQYDAASVRRLEIGGTVRVVLRDELPSPCSSQWS